MTNSEDKASNSENETDNSLQDVEMTIEFNTSNTVVEYTDSFGHIHTFEGRFIGSLINQLQAHLELDDLTHSRYVPLDQVDSVENVVHGRICNNQKERYYKALEAFSNHPAMIHVEGSKHAFELWCETPYAKDSPDIESIERKFGLERQGSFVRYNDTEESLVRHITWDVKEHILVVGEPGYDEFIDELPDELPEYEETIDKLINSDS